MKPVLPCVRLESSVPPPENVKTGVSFSLVRGNPLLASFFFCRFLRNLPFRLPTSLKESVLQDFLSLWLLSRLTLCLWTLDQHFRAGKGLRSSSPNPLFADKGAEVQRQGAICLRSSGGHSARSRTQASRLPCCGPPPFR